MALVTTAAETQVVVAVDACVQQIQVYEGSLRSFVTTLVSLYRDHETMDTRAVVLRDALREEAAIYEGVHLKMSVEFLQNLKDFMEYYANSDLHVDDFVDSLGDIVEEGIAYNEKALFVKEVHQRLLDKHKDINDKAIAYEKDCSNDWSKYSEEQKEAAMRAERYDEKATEFGKAGVRTTAASLLLAPVTCGVSLLGLAPAAGFFVKADRKGDKRDACSATANQRERDAQGALVSLGLIRGQIADCITSFSSAITTITEYFGTLSKETESFKKATEKAVTAVQRQGVTGNIKIHYTLMKGPARRLVSSCNVFFGAYATIEVELGRLPPQSRNVAHLQAWIDTHEAGLNLDAPVGTRNEETRAGWLTRVLPSLRIKEAPKVWMQVLMDNAHGSDVLTQRVSAYELINEYQRFQNNTSHAGTGNQSVTAGVNTKYNIVGAGSVGADISTTIQRGSSNTNSQENVNEHSRKHGSSGVVTLTAGPGRSVLYHLTLRRGGAISVRTLPVVLLPGAST